VFYKGYFDKDHKTISPLLFQNLFCAKSHFGSILGHKSRQFLAEHGKLNIARKSEKIEQKNK
jgi:hypothetical protein